MDGMGGVGNVVGDALTQVIGAIVDRPSILLAALLALLAVGWTAVWRWTRTVVTIAHEGGHALVAVLVGRGLTGIRLHPDTSGLTVSTGARRGPGLVLTFLGGYPFPSLLGAGGAVLVAAQHARWMLWIVLGALVLTLIWVRNLFGGLAVASTAVLVAAVVWWGSPRLQDGFAAALSWFLVFGGLRAVRELQRGAGGRRHRRCAAPATSDADMLAALTHLPRGLWLVVFWLLSLGAVFVAVWVLVI